MIFKLCFVDVDVRQGKLTSQTPSWYASFWVNHRVYLKIESALSPFPIKVWFKTALKYIHFFLPQEIVFSNIIHYILLVKTTITFSENLRSLKSLCPPPNRKKNRSLERVSRKISSTVETRKALYWEIDWLRWENFIKKT